MGKVIPYFKSEWSFASFAFTKDEQVPVTKCAFVSDSKLVLINANGGYILLEIDETNKELVMKEENNLVDFV